MPVTTENLPLVDVRVLDLSRVFAGPLAAQTLADLGAEVIKVEHPKRGDDTRDWGTRIGKTETNYYNSMNRNKRSITLDLKTPQGQRRCRKNEPGLGAAQSHQIRFDLLRSGGL